MLAPATLVLVLVLVVVVVLAAWARRAGRHPRRARPRHGHALAVRSPSPPGGNPPSITTRTGPRSTHPTTHPTTLADLTTAADLTTLAALTTLTALTTLDCGARPWPHLLNGTSVPEPGSEEDLPGLDPIDPHSTDPAVTDRRTHGQKLLDGLIDCLKLAARTGLLPITGGLRPQVFISTTQAELERKNTAGEPLGIALAPYSGPQPLAAFAETLCDADITGTILGDGSEILNVGRTQRLFTTAQRKILLARDLGCTFPDCTKPGTWTEAHHILPWYEGGESNINNAAPLCGPHHTHTHQGAWTVRLHHGIPFYTPSYNVDPTQHERRNTYHHGTPRTQNPTNQDHQNPPGSITAGHARPPKTHPITNGGGAGIYVGDLYGDAKAASCRVSESRRGNVSSAAGIVTGSVSTTTDLDAFGPATLDHGRYTGTKEIGPRRQTTPGGGCLDAGQEPQ
ncbi:HNH endonuclease signature motif containing protein [Arthrobacter sp. AQ5-05]|uniref:HNH endonuclease signature motif containing protein n=1 Tax=Arthrobacter sp. AQ5-05 TaxID=2184581 RepID=UPI0012B62052|nr:HNH endonuclease signature motif containing protein [Arthrobacter sp. AQ5-05]